MMEGRKPDGGEVVFVEHRSVQGMSADISSIRREGTELSDQERASSSSDTGRLNH